MSYVRSFTFRERLILKYDSPIASRFFAIILKTSSLKSRRCSIEILLINLTSMYYDENIPFSRPKSLVPFHKWFFKWIFRPTLKGGPPTCSSPTGMTLTPSATSLPVKLRDKRLSCLLLLLIVVVRDFCQCFSSQKT